MHKLLEHLSYWNLAYAGLALAHGALCLGVDSALVYQCSTAFYAALAAQRH